jgi:hypothetical protein
MRPCRYRQTQIRARAAAQFGEPLEQCVLRRAWRTEQLLRTGAQFLEVVVEERLQERGELDRLAHEATGVGEGQRGEGGPFVKQAITPVPRVYLFANARRAQAI